VLASNSVIEEICGVGIPGLSGVASATPSVLAAALGAAQLLGAGLFVLRFCVGKLVLTGYILFACLTLHLPIPSADPNDISIKSVFF
jgi:hypothetical protein